MVVLGVCHASGLRAVALALAVLALAALCPPADAARYALLVGVRQYDRAELSSLDYTENDATNNEVNAPAL